MTLNDSELHKTYTVQAVDGLDLALERRLEALGLTEGTEITVLNRKPGALIVKMRGTRFAMGSHIAGGIRVAEVTRP